MSSDIILKGVETEEELIRANDLMAKVHMQDSFEALRWLQTSGAGYPGYRPEHTRIAVCDGEVAAALRLTTDTVRIGEARLKVGGLGWVTTAGTHRHKGFARELIGDTLRYMRMHNYHVSMLFGIPNFYHRFGFVTTLAEYATTVSLAEASMVSYQSYRVRPGKPGDIRMIQKLHQASENGVACSLVRSAAHITNKWERWKAVRVLTDDNGKVLAYFLPRTSDEELHIEEAGVAGEELCGAVVRACAEMATEECVGRIRFAAPPSHALIQHLMRYRSQHEMRVTRDEGGMMAFVQLGEALESMIPEWESKLVQGGASQYQTEVTLLVDRKPYRIRAHRGALDISLSSGNNKVSLSSGDLLQLITGYRYVDELLAVRRRILTPEARSLLGVLFPKRSPYMWIVDRF